MAPVQAPAAGAKVPVAFIICFQFLLNIMLPILPGLICSVLYVHSFCTFNILSVHRLIPVQFSNYKLCGAKIIYF